MSYRKYIFIFIIFFFNGCYQTSNVDLNKNNFVIENKYKNLGFTLIYNDDLKDIKKLDDRSLNIYHKSLKRQSSVKIINPKNGNFLIAHVKSNKVKFSNFYNSVISLRIAEVLELDHSDPYIEIKLIPKNSTFVAKKSKTFEEEKLVAEKAPVDGILISDLNIKKIKKIKQNKTKFSYSIKVADFYYKESAKLMINRIRQQTSIKNLQIIKLSKTNYRVLIGPFNDIKSLKKSFEKMNQFEFENLEIIQNV